MVTITKEVRYEVFVRHAAKCTHKAKGDQYRGCNCGKWLYETRSRKRRSAKTRSWERAVEKARDLEYAANHPTDPQKPNTSGQLADEKARAWVAAMKEAGVSKDTWEKAERWVAQRMVSALAKQGVTCLHQVETHHLEDWRTTWREAYGMKSLFTKQKMSELLSSFFLHCLRNKWIVWNPCKGLRPVRPGDPEAEFFTEQEYATIEDSVIAYAMETPVEVRRRARTRLRTFIRLLRWSGARITDAAIMQRKSLEYYDGKWTLRFRMLKTDTIAVVPLPAWFAEELKSVPPADMTSPAYFFWSGNGDPETASKDWWERISVVVFKNADLKNEDGTQKHCKPHMFRDTFAVLALQKGATLEDVQKALGHKSIKITERSYGHWSRAREERMHDVFAKTWDVVPIDSKKRKAS